MEQGVGRGLYVYIGCAQYAPGTGTSATPPRAACEPACLRVLLFVFLSCRIAPLSSPIDFDFNFVFDFDVGLFHPVLILVGIIMLSLIIGFCCDYELMLQQQQSALIGLIPDQNLKPTTT